MDLARVYNGDLIKSCFTTLGAKKFYRTAFLDFHADSRNLQGWYSLSVWQGGGEDITILAGTRRHETAHSEVQRTSDVQL